MLRGIRPRVLLSSLVLLAALLIALGVVLVKDARGDAARSLEERVRGEATALAASRQAVSGVPSEIQAVTARVLAQEEAVIVLGAGGSVLYASPGSEIASVQRAPEVRAALNGSPASEVRHSPETGDALLYVAVPVTRNGETIGALRISAPRTAVADAQRDVVFVVGVGGAAALVAAALLGLTVTGPLRSSVRELTGLSRRLASGSLAARNDQAPAPDIEELAVAIHDMAENLERRIVETYQDRDTFAAIIHAMADGLVVTDHDGNVTLINPAAAQVFNVTASEAVGQRFMEVVRDYEIADVYRKVLATRRQQTGQSDYGPDPRRLHMVAAPIEEKAGSSVMVIIQDRTEALRLEEARREFVANVSHELRTPLASIKAAVEALQAGAVDDRDLASDFLHRINVEVDELTDMVQRLMDLARIETGRARFVKEPLELGTLIEDTVDRLRPQAQRKDLTVTVEVPAGLPPVMADRSSVLEVLINIVGNAIKFTPAGGAIGLTVRPGEAELEVSVRDNGVGIASEHMPYIFQRFYKGDRSRSSQGIGLGLALAMHLVQAQGGRIWAESEPGAGAAFHFTLPLSEEGAPT